MAKTTGRVAWARTTARIFEVAGLTVTAAIEPAVPLGLATIAALYLYATAAGSGTSPDAPPRPSRD